MIIECISCKKKFEVNSNLIPKTGRNIQCGVCGKVWFFAPKKENLLIKEEILSTTPRVPKPNIKKIDKEFSTKKNNNINKANKKSFELTKYQAKSNITLSKFLSYILVFLITFVALIILIDTFKAVLYEIFPNLESLLFSLFELLKDIKLFIKDLI